jgi:hypothetical protein
MPDRLSHLTRRPWRDLELPPDAVGIPTMLSKSERKLLYSLARDYAEGDNAIVDAGCFLGGSTAALLAGIRDRGRRWTGPPLESYDLFRVDDYMVPKFFSADQSLPLGDSFRPRFDTHIARFDLPHVVHEGDITSIGWSGGPIEILFLDLLKSWEINDAVLRDFFPSLVPGRSVIVHQDYGWGGHQWIPITVELLRDSLVLVDRMEWGSHVFFVKTELPSKALESGVRDLDLDVKIELIDQAIAHSDDWFQGMLEVDRALLIAERDGAEAAVADLASIRHRRADEGLVVQCVNDVRPRLEASVAAPPR